LNNSISNRYGPTGRKLGHLKQAARTAILCVILASLTSLNCGEKNKATAGINRYQLRGQVVQLDPQGRVALIKHHKIEGWMEAMTMEFPVKDRREFQALHVGDSITATVFVRDLDYWIGEIHREDAPTR